MGKVTGMMGSEDRSEKGQTGGRGDGRRREEQ